MMPAASAAANVMMDAADTGLGSPSGRVVNDLVPTAAITIMPTTLGIHAMVSYLVG